MSTPQQPPVPPADSQTPPQAPSPPASAPAPSSPANGVPAAQQPSYRDYLLAYSSSPYPAFSFTAGLSLVPIVRPPDPQPNPAAAQPAKSSFASVFKKNSTYKAISPYPSNTSVLLFGGLVGLGGFLIYDHDVEDGCGVVSAWSLLYTLVNGKKSLTTFRFYPKLLTVFALANTTIYGGRFFSLF